MSRRLTPDEWVHGTCATYQKRDCRCGFCRAWKAGTRPGGRPLVHGTWVTARKWKCCCPECAAWKKDRWQREKAARRGVTAGAPSFLASLTVEDLRRKATA